MLASDFADDEGRWAIWFKESVRGEDGSWIMPELIIYRDVQSFLNVLEASKVITGQQEADLISAWETAIEPPHPASARARAAIRVASTVEKPTGTEGAGG
jgi:hypothetical protein